MASALWQALIRFDSGKIAPEIAIRNAIGIVLPLIAGAVSGNPAAGAVASLGALNVSYSDGRDAYIVRARRMLLASVLVGVAAAAGALAARNDWTSMLATMAWAFGAGMLVVVGPKAGDLGTVTLVTLIIFGARRLSVPEALTSGLLTFAGGLLQMFLSIVTWPVKPYGPETRIMSNLYRALADAAVSHAGAASPPPATAAVVTARESLEPLDPSASDEAARLLFLLNQAERIRLSLLTVRRLARRLGGEPETKPAAEALERVLREASAVLRAIGESAEAGRAPAVSAAFNKALCDFRDGQWETTSPRTPLTSRPTGMAAAFLRDAMRQMDRLSGQIRAVSGAGMSVSATRVADPSGRRVRLAANLSFRSAAFRHAARLAVCVGLGVAIGRGLQLERAYWLPMTIAIVLKPDFVGTFSRGILRMAGTMAGLLVATAAVHLLPNGITADIALLAVFSLLLRWAGPANYGIFVVAVSGVVVLLIAMTGVNPRDAIVARAINTALGGAVALIAYRLWPTWERSQAGPVLGEMLHLYKSYFHSVIRGPATDTDQAELQQIRNAGRVARSNAEASGEKLAAEPGTSPEKRQLFKEILISTHSFIRAVMALESDYDGSRTADVQAALRDFTAAAMAGLELIARAMNTGRRPVGRRPEIRAAWTALEQVAPPHSLLIVETDRIATSLNTLWELAVKWNATP